MLVIPKLLFKQSKNHALLAVLLSSFLSQPALADQVTQWNKVTIQATKTGVVPSDYGLSTAQIAGPGLNSNLASRVHAIEAIAVYNAVNAINHVGPAYKGFATTVSAAASQDVAVAQAAYDVILNVPGLSAAQLAGLQAQKPNLDLILQNTIASANNSLEAANGVTIGHEAAAHILALRQADNASPNQTYTPAGFPVANPGAGKWRPTPAVSAAAFQAGINSQWGSLTPFSLIAPNQFPLPLPPVLGSPAYVYAFNQVKTLGAVNSAVRSTDQTHIAQFYKQDGELAPNEAARVLAESSSNSLALNALIFALTDIAIADARVAVWNGKYTHSFWRPVTSINAFLTTNDYLSDITPGFDYSSTGAWKPLIDTPPHPSYASGHSATVSAGIEVLKEFFGNRHVLTLHTTTAGLNPATRTVQTLDQIIAENGNSRIFGGIHYSFDNAEGNKLGKSVATWVIQHPDGSTSTAQ